jgi:hypothetical protein
LHAGGAIGKDGSAGGIDVELPDSLSRFVLPTPPTGQALIDVVRASLGLLDGLAPDRVAFPLLASKYRAVLGGTDFSLFLVGPTGVLKTELAALVQQGFGAGMDSRNLPCSWSSTGNALEGIASAAKDTVLVVDDFAPTGSTGDILRFHRDADRLLRAQGNHSGRQRMRSDGSLRPTRPPRGQILATGEDVPRGQSLRARQFVLEVADGDVDLANLTRCQQDARNGLYAAALAGYLQSLAPNIEAIRDGLQNEFAAIRDDLLRTTGSAHARTPGIVADLLLGIKYLLQFALEVGAISQSECNYLRLRARTALIEAADAQTSHQQSAEPTQHFLRLLAAALSSGRAHVASLNGGEPANPASWGWRTTTIHGECGSREAWQEQGYRIGWIDGDNLFLEPDASFAQAQRLAAEQGESLSVSQRTLHKRLHEKGLLASTDARRQTMTVRKTLEGKRREVLHFHGAIIEAQSDPARTSLKIRNDGAPDRNWSGRRSEESGLNGHPTKDPTTANGTAASTNGEMVRLVSSKTAIDAAVDSTSIGMVEEGEI